MLSENSFFKKIPAAITLEQRLIWEGAGWAIDTIFWAFERLKSAAAEIDPSSTYPTVIAREIFACSWLIIDQSHMLRQLFSRIPLRPGGPTSNFVEKFKA